MNNSDFAMMGLDGHLLIYLNCILEFVLYFVELSASIIQPGDQVTLGVDIYKAMSAMEVKSCDDLWDC